MARKIIFSDHALLRMEERFISRKMVLEAIKNPDKVEKSTQNLFRFLIKKIYFNSVLGKDHLLVLICEASAEKLEIITIIDTSKISKYF